jgi:hypothetical protein
MEAPHWRSTRDGSSRIATVLLAAKTAAEEGLSVIRAMLIVGLIFASVIALGQLSQWLSHRRNRH